MRLCPLAVCSRLQSPLGAGASGHYSEPRAPPKREVVSAKPPSRLALCSPAVQVRRNLQRRSQVRQRRRSASDKIVRPRLAAPLFLMHTFFQLRRHHHPSNQLLTSLVSAVDSIVMRDHPLTSILPSHILQTLQALPCPVCPDCVVCRAAASPAHEFAHRWRRTASSRPFFHRSEPLLSGLC